MKFHILGFWITMALLSCNSDPDHSVPSSEQPNKDTVLTLITEQSFIVDSNEHYRGLEIANGIAYFAGSNGGIYSIDLDIPIVKNIFAVEGRHFRDIDVLENGNIIALAITRPAEIWLKEADQDTFELVFESLDTLTFLDGVDFWDNDIGLAFGDPVHDQGYFLKTNDGGKSWNRLSDSIIPNLAGFFGGFAASGTNLICLNDSVGIIGLAHPLGAFYRTDDYGKSWDMIHTDFPYAQINRDGIGIYSLTFKDGKNGVAVGGHWEDTHLDSTKIYTQDGGITWQMSEGLQEYRSCVAYYKDNIYISTGTTGTDITYDGGRTWELLDSTGYNAIAFQEDGRGIAVGSYGQVALLKLE